MMSLQVLKQMKSTLSKVVGLLLQRKIHAYTSQRDIFPNLKSDWGDVYWQFDSED